MEYGNFSSGIGLSRYDQRGFDTIVGCDIHSVPGSITGSKAMTNADSGSLVDGLPNTKVTVPAGDTYMSAGTKIFKVTTAGVVTLAHTAPATVTGLGYHRGYLYYTYTNKLGRFDLSSTWTDAWQTFTNSHTNPRHMLETNLSLFITDKNLIASVDNADTFSANVLDLEQHQIAVCLANYATGLLIGTRVADNYNEAGLFWWDTYSSSWSTEDYINEEGVNMMIPADNLIFMQIGSVGNIYYWTGAQAKFFKRLRDDTDPTTSVNPYGSTNLNGLPLIATNRGIYSLGQADTSLPRAQVIEYVPSEGQGATVGALASVGNQVFAGFQNATDYGIDKLDTNYYSGFFTTPLTEGKLSMAEAHYDSVPGSSAIAMSVATDEGSMTSKTVVKDDTKDRKFYLDARIVNKSTAQLKTTLTADGTNTPIIRKVILK